MAECDVEEAVLVARGFQFQNHWHFSHHIKCITQETFDAVFVFYNIGSENVASLCPYKPHNPRIKHSLPSSVSNFIYARKFRLLVASCPDLSIRIFNEEFDLIDTVQTGTVLSLAFNEATSEVYTGGVGCIKTWLLRHQLHNPLVLSKPFTCSVSQDQWVISLDFDTKSEILAAASQDAVYVINTRNHDQVNFFTNTHPGSLTSAVYFHPLEYVITASKDGSIKIWNCILDSELHTFLGHLKAVTALKVHPNAPCVISCSYDGSIRTWHLENMTQCYYLDCGEQLLGMCTDFAYGGNRLACFSFHSVIMWQVNQVETHFATVNSNILSMSRVEDFSHPSNGYTTARILALAEDGGVRLLSPVTGQVITIMLPMSSSQLLKDVVYSLNDRLLFVLLKSGEVVVFSASTNPCSACQLWVASPNRQLCSVALCSVSLPNGEICSLVFGGDKSGHIALLFSSGNKLSMPLPCPAHDGHVTKLIGSCDPVVPFSDDPDGSSVVQTALISYGHDNMLNIWCVKLKKSRQITLKLQMSIHTELEPLHGRLLGSIFCVSFLDNRVVMMNMPKSRRPDSRIIATSQSLSRMSLLTHQQEDDHTNAIISLQCCPALGLFATSGKDGYVKIWNLKNQLVSEIEFGATLASVCFANPQGDLLIGFQKHISVIVASDYLPKPVLNAVSMSSTLIKDCTEQPMTFDSDLEFWYDSKRIPCYSAEQDSRTSHGAARNITNITKHSKAEGQSVTLAVPSEEEMKESAESLQSMVDVGLAREMSQQYAVTVHATQSKFHLNKQKKQHHYKVKEEGFNHEEEHVNVPVTNQLAPQTATQVTTNSMERLREKDSTLVPAATSLPTDVVKSSLSFYQNAGSGHLDCVRRKSGSLPRLAHQQSIVSLTSNIQFPKAEVLRVHLPSGKYPIAPDCFIPNSVLRSKFKYIPPVVILEPYQPPNIRQKMLKLQKSNALLLARSESDASCFSSFDEYQFVDYSENDLSQDTASSSHETVTCVSRLSGSRGGRRRTADMKQKLSRNRDRLLHPTSAADRSHVGWNESQYSINFSQSDASDIFLSTSDERLRNHPFLKPDKLPSKSNLLGKRTSRTKKNVRLVVDEDVASSSHSNNKEVSKASRVGRRESQNSMRVSIHSPTGHPCDGSPKTTSQQGHNRTSTRIQAEVHRRSLPLPDHPGSDRTSRLSLDGISTRSLPKKASSIIFGRSKAVDSTKLQGSTGLNAVELDAVRTVVMQKIVSSSWYPRDLQIKHSTSGDMKEVVNTLLSLQKSSSATVFRDICSVLLELNSCGVLIEEQKMAVASELSERIASSVHTPLTTAALDALEKIGVGTRQILLRILPLLTDPNVEVRYAAFSALRAITGVANRLQLHRLLIKLGLLQDVALDEDEVLNSLADRVDKGNLQLQPNSRILDMCSVGANYSCRERKGERSFSSVTRSRDGSINSSDQSTCTSSKSKRRRHTLQNNDQSTLQKGSQNHYLHRRSIHQGRGDIDNPLDTGQRSSGTPVCGMNSLGMFGESVFSHVPHTCTSYKSPRSNVHALYLQCPNNYSQSTAAARLMLEAYGSRDVKKAADFKWSEMFPVIRRPSRMHVGKSINFYLEPMSDMSHSVFEVQPPSTTNMKLPHILRPNADTSLNKDGTNILAHTTLYRGASEIIEGAPSLRSTNRDIILKKHTSVSRFSKASQQSRENFKVGSSTESQVLRFREDGRTGLVIKLPQIASLRVAALNS